MKKYRLLMNGQNFLIKSEKGLEKMGFYQTLFLESLDAEQAEQDAVEIIRNSNLREVVSNVDNDPPIIYLEMINELDVFDHDGPNIQGRSFYCEKADG